MLFSESMCFFKKTRTIPDPIMDSDGQIIQRTKRTQSMADLTLLPPTRPARAYSNKHIPSPTKTPGATSPSWMRKVSLGTSSRSGSVDSNASSTSTSSKLSFSSLRRKKITPEPAQERRPSLWTHHMHGEPRTVFRNAGRDERGRLRLEYREYDEVEW